MAEHTVYKPVTFVGKGAGTLKLYEDQLTFQMYDPTAANKVKIFTLPWSKVQRRQVSDSGTGGKPKFKLILKSGTEAVLKMDDRASLEVLRDDIAERLQRYKALHPNSDDEAVNKTRSTQSGRRQSTPYRMAKPTEPPVSTTRESQPYRMAKPPEPTTAPRESQPYRLAQPDKPERRRSTPYRMKAPEKPPVNEPRQSQPYRMKAKEVSNEPRQSQPYRYAKK